MCFICPRHEGMPRASQEGATTVAWRWLPIVSGDKERGRWRRVLPCGCRILI
jgi:hypothetical protein